MSKNANKPSALRIVIPLIAVLVGLLVVFSQMSSSGNDGADKDADNQAQGDPQAPTKEKDPADDEPDGDGGDDTADDSVVVKASDLEGTPATPEFKVGDIVLSVNGDKPEAFKDIAEALALSGDNAVTVVVKRDGVEEPLTLTLNKPDDEPTPPPDVVDPLDNLRPAFDDTPASLDEPDNLIAIGSADPASGFELFADINPYRASIYRASLTNVKTKVTDGEPYQLLGPVSYDRGETNYPEIGSYAARSITINGKRVALARQDSETDDWFGAWKVDSTTSESVRLSLVIQGGPDDAPADVVRITRTYRIDPGSHTINLDQQIENLTGKPLNIKWEQLAQGDVHQETNDYLRGRSLHYVTGYFREEYDPQRFSIYVEDDEFIPRPDLISKLKDREEDDKWESVWPNPKVDRDDALLAWLASENRYFVAISSPDVDPKAEETADIPALESIYPTITTSIYPDARADKELSDEKRMVEIGLTSAEIKIQPGMKSKPSDLSLDLFVGPREDAIFAEAPYSAMHFEKTIRYSLGGFCGFCTFQWLAHLLLDFLELLYAVVSDWGVAIIILVLVVRLLLHPITKRGQINMMKMGKQMAAVQPEMDKLKKKYADEPRKMQQAQMELFREKGINPAAGALGCLPMLLQMPIWIALYAMLYYAIELRHEHAFYGLFQLFGNWPFLADLSSADRFIPLFKDDGKHVLNLLFIRFDYSSINILPLLMGVTFFINMKFTTPPPMNEQQATQQKIMRIMPLLFPFFLYSAPSGLTLYICASTFAGIIDSYIVRKHVKELEESGELFKPKKRKPGGFMDKLQKAAEMRAQQMEDMKQQKQQTSKGPQQYKKRRKK